ncbi:MAG: hypothetical protein AB7V36_03495 [Bacteroidales bacterium]
MMKKFFLYFFVIVASTLALYGSNYSLKRVEMYLVPKNKLYRIPISIDNIKKRHEIFVVKHNVELLSSKIYDFKVFKTELENYSLVKDTNGLLPKILVVLVFSNKFFRQRIAVYFSPEGPFYFKGSWREMHALLFYYLFFGFDDYLISKDAHENARLILQK